MTYSPANTRSIVTAMVGEGGDLLILLSDETALNAGRVVGPPGEKGDRGMPGVKGDRGADGNTILTLDTNPDASDGKLGDWAINRKEHLLFGPKTSAGWGKGNPMTLTPASLDAAVRRFNSKGGPGGGRIFGMGAPSAGIAPTQQAATGLAPIIGNGYPAPAFAAVKVAEDAGGTLFDVDIRAESATGVWAGTVRVGSFGTTADHTVFGELLLGTAPVLTFTPQVVGTSLALSLTSDVALTKLEGVQIILKR